MHCLEWGGSAEREQREQEKYDFKAHLAGWWAS